MLHLLKKHSEWARKSLTLFASKMKTSSLVGEKLKYMGKTREDKFGQSNSGAHTFAKWCIHISCNCSGPVDQPTAPGQIIPGV